jgi:hypothetical protein
LFCLDYWIHVPPHYWDTFFLESVGITFSLFHSSKCLGYNDTSFIKHRSALDTIIYFDSEWIKNEKNLYEFWDVDKDGSDKNYFNDPVLIYAIEPIEGTDSLLFRRVSRNYLRDTD